MATVYECDICKTVMRDPGFRIEIQDLERASQGMYDIASIMFSNTCISCKSEIVHIIEDRKKKGRS